MRVCSLVCALVCVCVCGARALCDVFSSSCRSPRFLGALASPALSLINLARPHRETTCWPARNFKLLDELEEAEKGSKSAADISLGLMRADDMTMSDWQASIFVGSGGGEVRMWTLKIHCCANYPKVAPQISFLSKIIMDGVDGKGNLAVAKVPYLASWNASKTMHGALTEIKGLISKASRSQPPEESRY
jgi:ubiquitin-conjugating enzyme E2 variant